MLSTFAPNEILAFFVGLYLIAAGIGLALNAPRLVGTITELEASYLLSMMAGILAFGFGAVILGLQPGWDTGREMFLTLLGWIALIKGIVLLAFGNRIMGFFRSIAFSTPVAVVIGGVWVALGLWLMAPIVI